VPFYQLNAVYHHKVSENNPPGDEKANGRPARVACFSLRRKPDKSFVFCTGIGLFPGLNLGLFLGLLRRLARGASGGRRRGASSCLQTSGPETTNRSVRFIK
jgi:hypothetical protein